MRTKKMKMFKDILEAVEKQSKCTRLKVGALLVKDNRIISMGYNGFVSGEDDGRCKEGCKGCQETVHAEMNAILFAAKEGLSTQGTTLICSYSPCINCQKHIINAGIDKVIFLNYYRDSLELLSRANIEVLYFDGETFIK